MFKNSLVLFSLMSVCSIHATTTPFFYHSDDINEKIAKNKLNEGDCKIIDEQLNKHIDELFKQRDAAVVSTRVSAFAAAGALAYVPLRILLNCVQKNSTNPVFSLAAIPVTLLSVSIGAWLGHDAIDRNIEANSKNDDLHNLTALREKLRKHCEKMKKN